jgi:hypothetical protein
MSKLHGQHLEWELAWSLEVQCLRGSSERKNLETESPWANRKHVSIASWEPNLLYEKSRLVSEKHLIGVTNSNKSYVGIAYSPILTADCLLRPDVLACLSYAHSICDLITTHASHWHAKQMHGVQRLVLFLQFTASALWVSQPSGGAEACLRGNPC